MARPNLDDEAVRALERAVAAAAAGAPLPTAGEFHVGAVGAASLSRS
jgi:hypothetical protein